MTILGSITINQRLWRMRKHWTCIQVITIKIIKVKLFDFGLFLSIIYNIKAVVPFTYML